MTAATKSAISFTRGAPSLDNIPETLIAENNAAAYDTFGVKILQYGPSWGFEPLREQIAKREVLPMEQVVVGNSSMSILTYLSTYFLSPGDTVLVEKPSYDRAIKIFRRAGANVVEVPLETDGVDLNAFEEAIKTHSPKLAYLINDFQNPSGTYTSEEKRQAIAKLVVDNNILMIDDAAYHHLRYSGENATRMMTLAPEHTFTIGSFSKVLSPGLRTGWVMASETHTTKIAKWLEDSYISPNYATQGTIAKVLADPRFDEHLDNIKGIYNARLQLTLKYLNENLASLGAVYPQPEGGFFISLTLPATETPIWEAAKEQGLVLLNGNNFYVEPQDFNFIRIPFCSVGEADIEAGMGILTEVAKAQLS